jgi:hypothetical protein
MPKYAMLANRRALQKAASRQSLLALLSTPFVLWVLSAAFVTLGGAYVTARHECLVSAQATIDAYQQLTTEIFTRRLRVLDAASLSSNAIDFLKVLRSNAYANFKSFDGQSILSLIDQQTRLVSRISFLPHDTGHDANRFTTRIDGVLNGDPLQTVEGLDQQSFADFKEGAGFRALQYLTPYFVGTRTKLEPMCSIGHLVTSSLFKDDGVNVIEARE